MTLRRFANAILSALLAPPCAGCQRVLEHPLDGAACEACWAGIDIRCERFSLEAISRAQALGPYEGILRSLLHALKYDARRSIAPPLSRLMAARGSDLLADADFIIPVPLHRARLRERGFNQADDLARDLGVPVVQALRRVRATHAQVGLPATARKANVKDAFAVDTRDLLNGSRVVLVDDVATTGATLEACARVLRRAGAADVRALTAARVANGPR